MHTLATSASGALKCNCHHVRRPCRSRQHKTTVCRYDLRKSANNAEERRMERLKGTSAAERAFTPEQLKAAKASTVYQRAYHLCGGTRGQLSIQMCLFLFTEQPQLLELSTDLLAARISSLSKVVGIPAPDVAELLVRCGALIDVLPLRLNSTAESLSVALQIPKPQSLVMLAADINLLDNAPLRVKQQVDALAALLAVPVSAVAGMVAACPHILKVEGPAVQIRWANLQALLQLTPQQLSQLLQQEPRLLMPSSQNLSQNHTAVCQVLGLDPQTLNRWVLAVPMILLIAAQQLENRVKALVDLLAAEAALLGIPDAELGINPSSSSSSSASFTGSRRSSIAAPSSSSSSSSRHAGWVSAARDAAQVRAFISKDPRVLLLSPSEVKPRLKVVQKELMCSWECVVWLVLQHPSYLVVEPGSVTGWLYDVRHLCQMSSSQAAQLAACPQVFLTMSPEQVLLALQAFSQAQQISYVKTLDMCTHCPLLLGQHPAVTAAAMQQLSQLIVDQDLKDRILSEAPELLLLGSRLQQQFAAAAAGLSLSSSQLGLMIANQPSIWWVLVPRQQWQQQQQGWRQQQQQTPAWIEHQQQLILQSLSALKSSGLRSVAVMQELAVVQPALLNLGPAGLQQHVQILSEICSGCSYWQQELQASLPPVQLAKAILLARAWRSRLEFMVESDLSRRVSLYELMEMNATDFRRCFTQDYQLWRIDREQRWQQRLLHRQQQQQEDLGWQHQSEYGWRQVGDQLQLERQWQQPARQQREQLLLHRAAAAAAGVGAADGDEGLHKRLFASPSAGGSRQQQQQQLWQLSSDVYKGGESASTDAAEAAMFYGDDAGVFSEAQWQQHTVSSSSVEFSSSSYDSYDGDDESADEEFEQFSLNFVDNITDIQQQQQQQLLVEGQDRQARHGSRGIAWQEPPVTAKQTQLLSLQQSGVELYGSWEGCLLRPAESAPQQQQQQPVVL